MYGKLLHICKIKIKINWCIVIYFILFLYFNITLKNLCGVELSYQCW
jgi:hypothetical protein